MKYNTHIKIFFDKIKNGADSLPINFNLLAKLIELLKNLELIEWAIDESEDTLDIFRDYKNDTLKKDFFKHFSLVDNIKEAQEVLENLKEINLNIYFITLMSIYENQLNYIIRCIAENAKKFGFPIENIKPTFTCEYFIDDEQELSLKTNNKYLSKIEFSSIKQKLWCFHHLLNTKNPVPNNFLDNTDFEYYSLVRNQILHKDSEIVDLAKLLIYVDVQNEIFTTDGKILISKKFFDTALENLFDYCHSIAVAYEKKISHN